MRVIHLSVALWAVCAFPSCSGSLIQNISDDWEIDGMTRRCQAHIIISCQNNRPCVEDALARLKQRMGTSTPGTDLEAVCQRLFGASRTQRIQDEVDRQQCECDLSQKCESECSCDADCLDCACDTNGFCEADPTNPNQNCSCDVNCINGSNACSADDYCDPHCLPGSDADCQGTRLPKM